jgi:2-polyprenyl-6-hydroxyphenyl methylase/3-demethylubiquinone-9 3-methyltransferase
MVPKLDTRSVGNGRNEAELVVRFEFGQNWASYAKGVGEDQIAQALIGLRRLMPNGTLEGKRFLDIGCGSGLHSVAAARLGAKRITAVDIDPLSVETTRQLVAKHAAGANIQVEERSVFDLTPEEFGTFDVVYSWGVLHHTGNMWMAIRRAAAMVSVGGELAFALYRRTWCCPLWKLEKRWYAQALPEGQERARRWFISLFRLAFAIRRKKFGEYVAGYKSSRGMNFYHNVHDWLGGFPYESTTPSEVECLMDRLSFRSRITPVRRHKSVGLFGSGCDEYVYTRVD